MKRRSVTARKCFYNKLMSASRERDRAGGSDFSGLCVLDGTAQPALRGRPRAARLAVAFLDRVGQSSRRALCRSVTKSASVEVGGGGLAGGPAALPARVDAYPARVRWPVTYKRSLPRARGRERTSGGAARARGRTRGVGGRASGASAPHACQCARGRRREQVAAPRERERARQKRAARFRFYVASAALPRRGDASGGNNPRGALPVGRASSRQRRREPRLETARRGAPIHATSALGARRGSKSKNGGRGEAVLRRETRAARGVAVA